jgi:hypothetical protein
MAKSTKWAEVTCKVHGKIDDNCPHTRNFPQVVTAIGKTRKERRDGGCPVCQQEQVKV